MSNQFLRHYSLLISGPQYKEYGGTAEKDQLAREITDPLQITFNITKTITREPNTAEIIIYNLSPQTESEIIREGSQLTFLAGYEEPGVIFKGQIIQPTRGKQGTDYTLKLTALDGDAYINLGFLSGTILSNQTRRQIASQVLRQSNIQLDSVVVDDLPETDTVDGSIPRNERAKVVFGQPSKYLTNLSKMGNASFYIDNNEAKFFNPNKTPRELEAHLINAETGMIGLPQQIPYGVSVTCLLNPTIKLGDFIKIDNKSIIMEDVGVWDTNYYSHLLNADGIYRIIKIDYTGDFRGNEWFCHLTAISQVSNLPAMLGGAQGFLML